MLLGGYRDTMISRYLTTVVSRAMITGMKPGKAMTIRLSPEQAEALEVVAAVDDRALVEVVRAAISEHIESRRKDRAFQDSLKNRIDRAKQMLGK
jgi:predicted DNA-binding protein